MTTIELEYDRDNCFKTLSFHKSTHSLIPDMTDDTARKIPEYKPIVLPMPGNDKPVKLTGTFFKDHDLGIHGIIPFSLYDGCVYIQKNARPLYDRPAFRDGILDETAMRKTIAWIFRVEDENNAGAPCYDSYKNRKYQNFMTSVSYDGNTDVLQQIRMLYNRHLFNTKLYDVFQSETPMPAIWKRWLEAYEKDHCLALENDRYRDLNQAIQQVLGLFPDAEVPRLREAHRIVTKIGRPLWDKNGTNRPFVYIRVPVSLVGEANRSLTSKNDLVYKYQRELGMFAVTKIVSEARWKNTGLSAGCLALSHAAITAQSELVCTFEIKEELL